MILQISAQWHTDTVCMHIARASGKRWFFLPDYLPWWKDCGVEQADEGFAGGEKRVREEDTAWQ